MTTDEPAVNGWQAATEAHMATSAIGRALQEQLAQLRRDYNSVLRERNEAWAQLGVGEQIIRDAHERAEHARAENERLTARLGGRARAYQLTDKGLAATEPWTGEQTDTDAAKLIGEAIQDRNTGGGA